MSFQRFQGWNPFHVQNDYIIMSNIWGALQSMALAEHIIHSETAPLNEEAVSEVSPI